MRIGIVIAIVRELKAFLDSDYQVEIIQDKNREVYKTVVNNNELYAIKSGYGKIDAASASEYLISKYDVEMIINFGVTGALISGLKVDDLFIVRSTINHDYDVSPIDPVKAHQYEEFKDEHIPLDEGLIDFVKQLKPDLVDVVCGSGDSFIEKREDKQRLADMGCSICDMEIAGIARTCFINGIKCLSIKSISDTLEGDGGDFNQNVVNSANKAFNLMKEIIENL